MLGKALNLIKLRLGDSLILHSVVSFIITALKGLLLRFTSKISGFYTLAAKINTPGLLKPNPANQSLISS